ncbi:MAG: D-glycerate dehydrogenase, partial [Myxococcales bacterium]|nr:D-glycerate dehydrogenase [Myxococcales bacterium]
MKAVLHYRASPGFVAALERALPEDVALAVVEERDDARFAREIADAQVLLHCLEPVTAARLALAPQLALVQKIGVGLNTIDLDAARARGIAVANMPGTNTAAVAEHALALLLAALRGVCDLDAATRAGRGWSPDLALVD